METQQLVIASLLYLVPSLITFYFAVETYARNKNGRINLLGAGFNVSFSAIFLTLFLASISSAAAAAFLIKMVQYPLVVLATSFGMAFNLTLSKLFRHLNQRLLLVLLFIPVLLVLWISVSTNWIVGEVVKSGAMLETFHGPGYLLLALYIFLNTMGQMGILFAAIQRAGSRQRRNFLFMLLAGLFSIAWGVMVIILDHARPDLLRGIDLSLHSFIIWAVALHIIMEKYGFPPNQARKFERLFQLSPFAILLLDEQARVVEMNPSAKKMLAGFGVEEGHVLPSLARFEQPLAEFRQGFAVGRRERNLEVLIRTKAGESHTVVIDSDYIEMDDEVYKYFIIRDVTQEKESKRRQAESEQRYREIAERLEIVSAASNDGVWDLDVTRLEMVLTGSLFNRLGCTAERCSLSDCCALIHPDDFERVRREAQDKIGRGLELAAELRVKRPDGGWIWASIAAKGFTDETGSLVRLIGSIKDVTERKRSEEKIRHLAYHDALTGLPNRAFFHEKTDESLLNARRDGGKLALMLLDIDRFKIINDSLGHSAGDELLKGVANVLLRQVPDDTTVARLGGDEFVLLMPNVRDEQSVVACAQRIVEAFKRNPFVYEEMEWSITCSMGISFFPQDGGETGVLLKSADISMYHAKKHRGGRAVVFHPSMSKAAAERHLLEKDLQKAIENGELYLDYQPLFNMKAACIYGAEALLRWRSPTRGLIPPMDFIPIAEDSGLILPIGGWVVHTACRQMQEWRQAGHAPILVSINISALQFEQADFVEQIETALREYDVDPGQVCLEITESMTIGNTEACISKLERLNELGVRTAIDDFGTGYSSLSLLQKLPISMIKIDKSFIKEKGTTASPLVESMISLAHSLQLAVLAEGVETSEQYEALQALGCDYIQGYYIGKPDPLHVLEEHIKPRA